MRFRALTLLFTLLLGAALLSPAVLAQSTAAPPPTTTAAPPPAATAPPPQDTAKPDDAVKPDDAATAAPQDQKQPDTAPDQAGATEPAPATGDAKAKQEPPPSSFPHDGGKDDVSAIGNRKMGGRGLGNWYSLEKEIRIGKEYSQMVEQSVKLNHDPVVNEYVNRIGQNLVRNSDAKVPFTIKVKDEVRVEFEIFGR